MTRIITHQEETHYELAANSESLDFWKTLGFRIKGTGGTRRRVLSKKDLFFRYQAATGWAGHHTKQGKGGYSQQMGMHSASLPISED